MDTGSCGGRAKVTFPVTGWDAGSLSMRSVQFGGAAG